MRQYNTNVMKNSRIITSCELWKEQELLSKKIEKNKLINEPTNILSRS